MRIPRRPAWLSNESRQMSARASRSPRRYRSPVALCASLSIMAMLLSGCDHEAAQPVATDGPEAFDGEVQETARQYQSERYDELERLLTQYATLSERFDDGCFKLHALQECSGSPHAT